MKQFTVGIIIVLVSVFISTNCKKKENLFSTAGKFGFSTDTVLFDTLFTTIGSTTKYFKIYNNNKTSLSINRIFLGQGTNSQFRINVDGDAGVDFKNIEIAKGDSLFVFVEVTIDPTSGTTPFVVEDSVVFITDNNQQKVVLNAWGQDAYFHVNEIIGSNTTWPNDKPHVIYNYCAVDSMVTLTIPPGTLIHGHNNATLLIYKGSLQAIGAQGNPIVFMQDRVEDYLLQPADSVEGQWRGIYFIEPLESTISYSNIKNAVVGIQVDTLESGNKVNLSQVKIDNSLYAALLTQGGNVTAENCLFGNSSQYSVLLSIGGSLSFNQCTFGDYWASQRNSALFSFTDYYTYNNTIIYRPFAQADFSNCIVYGNNDNEFVLDTLDRNLGGQAPVFSFTNCIIKTDTTIANANYFTNCYVNQDPLFDNPYGWDYHLPASSPAVGKAIGSASTIDLDGNPRSANTIGCYEHN